MKNVYHSCELDVIIIDTVPYTCKNNVFYTLTQIDGQRFFTPLNQNKKMNLNPGNFILLYYQLLLRILKKALILGGGFAGVQAAIELQKKNRFDVILISERDYLYLYPISIWIPTREKSFDDVKVPLTKIQDAFGFNLLIGKVPEIRAAENKIICSERTLEYDYLVIAIGAEKMQHKGQENTLSICGKPEIILNNKG